jgi:hypothetical protein
MISTKSFLDPILFLILVAVEAVLFCNFFSREIAGYPLQDFDQTSFLTEAYQLEERVSSNGIGRTV